MDRSLNGLDETIIEIENELKNNPDPFLFSTLERLKMYQENELKKLIENAKKEKATLSPDTHGGFRGFGVS